MIIPLWLKVLEDAGSDYLHSRTSNNIRNQEYMQGKGGRTLKHIIRDFAESHRNAPTSCPSWCADGTEFISPDGGGRGLCWSSGLTSIYKSLSRERGYLLVPMTWLEFGSFVFLCIASHQRAKGGASCQTRLLWTNREPHGPMWLMPLLKFGIYIPRSKFCFAMGLEGHVGTFGYTGCWEKAERWMP